MDRCRVFLILVPLVLGACGSRGCGSTATRVERTEKTSPAPSVAANPELPGLGSGNVELAEHLRAALRARGVKYKPRTHHLKADGSPEYTNRLIFETSPYLLQHAHNPVNWFPWGKEAFERAKRENKPVLLSVGYSTCHWCHVMEEESFEDEAIARFINQHFIPIKVDREERPDVDDTYMAAVQMLTGGGGWPMTVALTPDKQPFFGGTYFPARDGERGARKGFLSILRELASEYATNRDAVVARAAELSRRMRTASAAESPGGMPGPELIARAVQSMSRSFDPTWGGFGRAPKFPRPVMLDLLLRHHRRTREARSLELVVRTLEGMARGGIYDQVGGGFHRYSTDAQWLVPHFEKMLYDNAELVAVYLAAYQVTGRLDFAAVARETLEYVGREMTSSEGAFYSATDADSPTPTGRSEEGWFFTWTPAEVDRVLGDDLSAVLNAVYPVAAWGNFEGRSILHRVRSDTEAAKELRISESAFVTRLGEAKRRLHEERNTRPPPFRDDKVLVSWNGLMISAFARAALVLGSSDYRARAERAASFVLRELVGKDGGLMRSYRDGRATLPGYLDDHAFLIQGLLDLLEATSDLRWLDSARFLQAALDSGHWDEAGGGYFTSSGRHEELLTRDKPSYDGAEPSGNSVAILNLLRLSDLTSDDSYRKRAERALAAFARELTRSPEASPLMLSALESYLDTRREIVIVSPNGKADTTLTAVVGRTYVPNRVFIQTTEGAELAQRANAMPFVAEKAAIGGRPTAFVCERGLCERPTSDPAVLASQLGKVTPLERAPEAP
jgi:uncharacterized protein YyaL (SSP411 family)